MGLFSSGKVGFVLAATGVAHFVAPDVFTDVTKLAFPNDTADWVQRNGATETAIGLALMTPFLKKAGKVSLVGYLGWLGYNAVNAQK